MPQLVAPPDGKERQDAEDQQSNVSNVSSANLSSLPSVAPGVCSGRLDSISSSSSSQNLSELRRRLGAVGKRRCFIRIQIPEQPLPYPFRSQIPEKPQKLGISGASQRQQPGGR